MLALAEWLSGRELSKCVMSNNRKNSVLADWRPLLRYDSKHTHTVKRVFKMFKQALIELVDTIKRVKNLSSFCKSFNLLPCSWKSDYLPIQDRGCSAIAENPLCYLLEVMGSASVDCFFLSVFFVVHSIRRLGKTSATKSFQLMLFSVTSFFQVHFKISQARHEPGFFWFSFIFSHQLNLRTISYGALIHFFFVVLAYHQQALNGF